MRLDAKKTAIFADALLESISRRSYHHACNSAHLCLASMGSPVWAEELPGVATYGPGEYEANQRVAALRYNVLTWMLGLCDPRKSWEASDEWPAPTKLAAAVASLKELCPEPLVAP